MHMMRSPDRRRRGRLLSAVAAAFIAALALAGCASSGSSPSAGSATSGDITWWGWTPTVQGAQAIGVASTTVAAGSATPAQAAATLQKTMQSQSS